MFKTFVVPADGPDHAPKATDVAVDRAQKYGAKLVVLTVYKHVSGIEGTQTVFHTSKVGAAMPSPEAALREWAHEAADAAARRAAGVEVMVKRGPPARTIVEFAEEPGADAIVMGSRGLGDVTGLLLGSVSHKVCNPAKCTCIAVK